MSEIRRASSATEARRCGERLPNGQTCEYLTNVRGDPKAHRASQHRGLMAELRLMHRSELLKRSGITEEGALMMTDIDLRIWIALNPEGSSTPEKS